MSLALITHSSFVRTRFPYTRRALLGEWSGKRSVNSFQTIPTSSPPVVELNVQAASPRGEVVVPIKAPSRLSVTGLQGVPVSQTRLEEVPLLGVAAAPVLKTSSFDSRIEQGVASPLSRKSPSIAKTAARFFLTLIMVISITVAGVLILPELYYTVFSRTSAVQEVASAAQEGLHATPTATPEPQPYMPPQNPDLPTGTWISIPRIGVYSEVRPTLNPDEALNQGVWMVPDFGRPGDTTQPTIMAAHRFGWDWWWQSDYWKYNSFYLLTETEPGDIVEIIYDQRKWKYQIYAAEEGELITDYDADLILYTCKFLNSPIRYFRYAQVVEE